MTILLASLFFGMGIGSGFGYWQGRKDAEREFAARRRLIVRYGGRDAR